MAYSQAYREKQGTKSPFKMFSVLGRKNVKEQVNKIIVTGKKSFSYNDMELVPGI